MNTDGSDVEQRVCQLLGFKSSQSDPTTALQVRIIQSHQPHPRINFQRMFQSSFRLLHLPQLTFITSEVVVQQKRDWDASLRTKAQHVPSVSSHSANQEPVDGANERTPGRGLGALRETFGGRSRSQRRPTVRKSVQDLGKCDRLCARSPIASA